MLENTKNKIKRVLGKYDIDKGTVTFLVVYAVILTIVISLVDHYYESYNWNFFLAAFLASLTAGFVNQLLTTKFGVLKVKVK